MSCRGLGSTVEATVTNYVSASVVPTHKVISHICGGKVIHHTQLDLCFSFFCKPVPRFFSNIKGGSTGGSEALERVRRIEKKCRARCLGTAI